MEAKELLALNVVRIRKLENLTQTALAKKIGITRKHALLRTNFRL